MLLWVTGPVAVGKSTFIKTLERGGADVLYIGKALRAKYGEDFFTRLKNPGAPEETDDEVAGMISRFVYGAVPRTASTRVVDGCPRNLRQVEWVRDFGGTVVWVNPPTDPVERWSRIQARGGDAGLVKARLQTETNVLSAVYTKMVELGLPLITCSTEGAFRSHG